MGHRTKVQLIQRKKGTDQWYINFPTVIAEAMEFEKSETVEWLIEDNAHLILRRSKRPDFGIKVKKTKR